MQPEWPSNAISTGIAPWRGAEMLQDRDAMNPLLSIARNAGHLLGARATTQAVRFVYVVALARGLGPELYGLLAYTQSWYLLFLPLVALGTRETLARDFGRDPELGANTAARVLGLRLILLPFAAVACVTLGLVNEPNFQVRLLLVLMALALIGRALAMWTENVFVACAQARFALHQAALFRPLEALLGCAVLMAGGGVLGVAAVHALSWGSQAAVGFWSVHRRLSPVRVIIDRNLPGLIRRGMAALLTILALVWFTRGPLILLRQIGLDDRQLGQIALALQLLELLAVAPAVLGQVALPAVSRAAANGKAFLNIVLPWWIAASLLTALGGFAFGGILLHWVFGDAYPVTGEMLGPLLLVSAPLGTASLLSQVSLGIGRTWRVAGAAVVATLVWIVVGLTALPWLGPWTICAALWPAACLWAGLLLAGAIRDDLVRPAAILRVPRWTVTSDHTPS